MTQILKPLALATCLAVTGTAASADDFAGFYGGAYGFAQLSGGSWGGGAYTGYNFAMSDGVYAGVEGDVLVTDSGGVLASGLARAAASLGPDALVYGNLGVGYAFSSSTAYWQVGAGAEVNVTETIFLRGSVDRLKPFAPLAPAYIAKFGVGARF